MALSLLGRGETVAYYLPLKRNKLSMEYLITNRRVMEIVNGFIRAQCSLKDVIPVTGHQQSEGEATPTFAARMGYGFLGPSQETKSRQVGSVVFFSAGVPVVTFYEIPDPKGLVDIVTAMQKSMASSA